MSRRTLATLTLVALLPVQIEAAAGAVVAQVEPQPPQRITDATVYLKAPADGIGTGFGQSVALGPDHLAAAVRYWSIGADWGTAVMVYARNGDQLTAIGTDLSVESPGPLSIAIDGHRLVVGNPAVGMVRLFELNDDSISELASIEATAVGGSPEFGTDVDVSGDITVIGDPGFGPAESSVSGAVIVVDESNGWTSPDVVDAADVGVTTRLGRRVAVSEGRVAASDGQDGVNIFELGAPADAVRLTSEDDEFGYALDLDGGVLVVGAPGADATDFLGTTFNYGVTTIYEVIEGAWQPVGGTNGSGDGARSGESVAVFGDMVLVGSPADRGSSTGVVALVDGFSSPRAGRVDFLTKINGQWGPYRFAKPLTLAEGMGFGSAVALAADAAIVNSVDLGFGTGINPAPGTPPTASGAVHLFPIRGADPARGVLISEPPTAIHEEGGPDTYLEFRLATKPAAPVDVSIELSDSRFELAGPFPGHLVTFDASNWSVPQRIAVRPAHNDVLDGGSTTVITVSQWSIDGDYYRQTSDPDNGFGRFIANGIDRDSDPRTIELQIVDDDVAYETVIVGVKGAGMLPSGMRYGGEDLLRWDPVTAQWDIEFDGSDVGLAGAELGPIDRIGSMYWYFSFAKPVTIPARYSTTGAAMRVGPHDIVFFEATRMGGLTEGRFGPYFSGRTYGLGGPGTEIDGFEAETPVPYISLAGSFRTRDPDGRWMTIQPSDIIQPYPYFPGRWLRFFRGSDVGLTQPGENLLDFSREEFGARYRWITSGGFSVPTPTGALTGSRQTVLECTGYNISPFSPCAYKSSYDIAGLAPPGRLLDGVDFVEASRP